MKRYFYVVQKVAEISRDENPHFLTKLATWAATFSHSAVLNSNNYNDKFGKFELLAGVGAVKILKNGSLLASRELATENRSWLFGHIGYDYKNQIEKLNSRHSDDFNFGDLTFFEPKFVVLQKRDSDIVEFHSAKSNQAEVERFLKTEFETEDQKTKLPVLTPKMTKAEYLEAIHCLKKEIQYGNIYEINYCQEFFAENAAINPVATYLALNEKSPMPFSAFYKNEEEYLICASPERYIKKSGNKIYSQPIKGTIKRGNSADEDEALKKQLINDLKEQTENVMIVDLVRNDLSRTAAVGSVEVDELFGVYQFPQVFQLISTVSSKLKREFDLIDILQTSFPMGSMTGAPKISAMKLADEYEQSKRGLYSGTVGYITPTGDADFNVVIRSLQYSAESKYLSVMVGGAITQMAEPE